MHAKLLEIIQIGPARAGIFTLPEKYWPEPGQYLPCQRLGDHADYLVTNLFPVAGSSNTLTLGLFPETWYPGDQFTFLPPQGNGFSLPPAARRVGLLAYGVSPERLLTLVKPAMDQGATVTLFTNSPLHPQVLNRLPALVEVSPLVNLDDYADWLDYLAVDLERERLEQLFAEGNYDELHCEGQVLVRTAMPCRGIGECGVCAIHTRHGWQAICTDGPVFPLKEFFHVAQ